MGAKKVLLSGLFGAVIFLAQLLAVIHVPRWGLDSPFPFTVLHSIETPLLLAAIAVFSLLSVKDLSERLPLYSIVVAATLQVGSIEAMEWLNAPTLVIIVFLLNAFMVVQFLLFGYTLLTME